jgi:hypothetical protein
MRLTGADEATASCGPLPGLVMAAVTPTADDQDLTRKLPLYTLRSAGTLAPSTRAPSAVPDGADWREVCLN